MYYRAITALTSCMCPVFRTKIPMVLDESDHDEINNEERTLIAIGAMPPSGLRSWIFEIIFGLTRVWTLPLPDDIMSISDLRPYFYTFIENLFVRGSDQFPRKKEDLISTELMILEHCAADFMSILCNSIENDEITSDDREVVDGMVHFRLEFLPLIMRVVSKEDQDAIHQSISKHIESEKIVFEKYRNSLDHGNISKSYEEMSNFRGYVRAYSYEFQNLATVKECDAIHKASQIGIDYSEMQDLLEGYNPAEVRSNIFKALTIGRVFTDGYSVSEVRSLLFYAIGVLVRQGLNHLPRKEEDFTAEELERFKLHAADTVTTLCSDHTNNEFSAAVGIVLDGIIHFRLELLSLIMRVVSEENQITFRQLMSKHIESEKIAFDKYLSKLDNSNNCESQRSLFFYSIGVLASHGSDNLPRSDHDFTLFELEGRIHTRPSLKLASKCRLLIIRPCNLVLGMMTLVRRPLGSGGPLAGIRKTAVGTAWTPSTSPLSFSALCEADQELFKLCAADFMITLSSDHTNGEVSEDFRIVLDGMSIIRDATSRLVVTEKIIQKCAAAFMNDICSDIENDFITSEDRLRSIYRIGEIAFEKYRNVLDRTKISESHEEMQQYLSYVRAYSCQFHSLMSEYRLDD
ncbi:hypothetical protein PRIPAC_94126 [Pristionchus pacificus]|uniref:Uncharacterized protein n=1 Tax=Pristionchus pacificus TaxID=54126 RepID=A0A2A6BAV2_PRIPA|nr:hypothetical protein PRIPAC_94126 [Pristionchus pacificus]|eukprot:PDM62997.1 hypothetical protein PRIPAC_50212 [Pristionchus pacificus]